MFAAALLISPFATDLTTGCAWQETNIGPLFLTGVSSIPIQGLVWSIDVLLNINFLAEAEELFLG